MGDPPAEPQRTRRRGSGAREEARVPHAEREVRPDPRSPEDDRQDDEPEADPDPRRRAALGEPVGAGAAGSDHGPESAGPLTPRARPEVPGAARDAPGTVPDGLPVPGEAPATVGPLGAASILCDGCRRSTPHRILRIDGGGTPRPGDAFGGIARCRVCHLTHRFWSEAVPEREVPLIISRGAQSTQGSIRLPMRRRLLVGSGVPGADPPLVIRRLDSRTGRAVVEARVAETQTIWAVPSHERLTPVSVVEGRRTRTVRATLDPGSVVVVGGELRVEGLELRVVAIRANARTHHDDGASFPVGAVDRIYARRRAMPPAGSIAWRRERLSPSSRASSTSSWGRSRSGPGTRTTRSRPRARRADGGATTQSSRDS